MQTYKPLTYLSVIIVSAFVYFLVKDITALIISFQESAPQLILYLNLVSGALILFPLLPVVLLNKQRINTHEYNAYLIALCALFYFIAWLFFSMPLEQHPKDALGAVVRGLIPFVVIIFVVSTVTEKYSQQLFIKNILQVLLFFFAVEAVLKIYMLANGVFYGAGINQYSSTGFLLTYLLLLFIKGKKGEVGSKFLLFILLVSILLSVLSFKRGTFVELVINMILISYFLQGKKLIKYNFFALILIVSSASILYQTAYFDKIVNRIESTFKSDYQLNRSTNTRINELDAIFRTLSEKPYIIWLTGQGPGAGYHDYGYSFKNRNELGQPYHVHSFIGIVLNRFGLIGIFLHLAIVFIILRIVLRLKNKIRKSKNFSIDSPLLIAISSASHILVKLPSTLKGNAYYGSYEFGIMVGLFLVSLALNKK